MVKRCVVEDCEKPCLDDAATCDVYTTCVICNGASDSSGLCDDHKYDEQVIGGARMAAKTNQYANLDWEPRHNQSEISASCSEDGSDIEMTNCMGILRFKRADKNYIANHLRRAAEMLENLPNELE